MGACCKPMRKGEANVSDSEIKKTIESKKKLLIWILGGPGSGKGTQCKMLSIHFKLAHLSTGDLLRKAVEDGETPLAKEIKATMEAGKLVDTDLVLDLLLKAMREAFENSNGFLIDGYPREIEQGERLCERIGSPHLIIFLDCPDSILEDRLIKRGEQSGRVDDNTETIRKRLKTYHDVSEPVLQKWREKVSSIDGSLVPLEVEQECIRVIEELQGKLKDEG